MTNYFLRAHTSKGHISLAKDTVTQADDRLFLAGGSKKMRGGILNQLIKKEIQEQKLSATFVHPTDGRIAEGMVTSKGKLVLADDPLFAFSQKYSETSSSKVNLNDCLKSSFQEGANEIRDLVERLRELQQHVYQCFQEGKAIHEKKEEIYLQAMDFSLANRVADDLSEDLLGQQEHSKEVPFTGKRFFGAATSFGPVNFIDEITQLLSKRVIIKGRSGSGKSTLMRKIAANAEQQGYNVCYFPCALDPDSLDMVMIPQLNCAILDGTAPHVIDPTRNGDQVVDMFERCMDPSVEKTYQLQLDEQAKAYTEKMKAGTAALRAILTGENKIDTLYEKHVDEAQLSSLMTQVNEMVSQ
ncbi:hypothetical protein [Alteribacter populi]|uniref:hypothetical protein n=1 Tax=Alteribacter populi TaxID=2011011 RepID=UPI000BBA498F|nr:hypothetical protein [Alteribacter populi]